MSFVSDQIDLCICLLLDFFKTFYLDFFFMLQDIDVHFPQVFSSLFPFGFFFRVTVAWADVDMRHVKCLIPNMKK